MTPRFVGYMAFGYGVRMRGVQGCCIFTPLLAVAPLAVPGCLPVAGVRDVVGTGAGRGSAASARGLERPCVRYLSFSGIPSSESDRVMTPLAASCPAKLFEALALGESAVPNPGANFGFVGEYSIVASTGGSFARFERRSTSIASIGIVDGMTLDAVLAVDICCATTCVGFFATALPALSFGFIPRLYGCWGAGGRLALGG